MSNFYGLIRGDAWLIFSVCSIVPTVSIKRNFFSECLELMFIEYGKQSHRKIAAEQLISVADLNFVTSKKIIGPWENPNLTKDLYKRRKNTLPGENDESVHHSTKRSQFLKKNQNLLWILNLDHHECPESWNDPCTKFLLWVFYSDLVSPVQSALLHISFNLVLTCFLLFSL